MSALATIDDLSRFWKEIPGEEIPRATELLSLASSYLRGVARNNNVDIDQLIANDSTGVFLDNVKMVLLTSVKRAMNSPIDGQGASGWSQTASPYAENFTGMINPGGDLYVTAKELALLGLKSISGKNKIGILRPVMNVGYHD